MAWEAEKAYKIFQVKLQASFRINSRWPEYAQRSAALGVYNSMPPENDYNPATMATGIKAIIDVVNQAEIDINALTTAESVDAFLAPFP